MQELQKSIDETGVVEHFINGKQDFLRESPALASYTKLMKTYDTFYKNLIGLLPKETQEEIIEEKLQELTNRREVIKKAPKSGVIVKGIDNCLVKFSRCCNPVPGDDIIGYITKGRGVSIHRTDCVNIEELLQDENRIIDVAWYDEKIEGAYNVDIEILSNDRTGLLSDIVKEITSQKINIMGVNTKTSRERIATIDITIEVENIDQLTKVIKAIRKVDSVYEVNRKK